MLERNIRVRSDSPACSRRHHAVHPISCWRFHGFLWVTLALRAPMDILGCVPKYTNSWNASQTQLQRAPAGWNSSNGAFIFSLMFCLHHIETQRHRITTIPVAPSAQARRVSWRLRSRCLSGISHWFIRHIATFKVSFDEIRFFLCSVNLRWLWNWRLTNSNVSTRGCVDLTADCCTSMNEVVQY